MEDYLKGAFFGMAVGVCIGAIIVAKNKKLAGKIKEGVEMAEEKVCDAKEMIEEKISECGQEKNAASQPCECDSDLKNKKSKNC